MQLDDLKDRNWLFPLSIKNDFIFNSSPRDFSVEEIPLYEFSGDGEHLIVHIRKKGLSTWELIDILSNHLGVPKRQIGYAGLKDKQAITTQYLSLPISLESALESFQHDGVKILSTTRHNNKLRVGHLKGNRFRLRFKKVLGIQKDKIEQVLDWIDIYGMPNYFGLQRFGNSGDNWLEGRKIVEGRLRVREKKMREFLISAYQSKLFNDWLSRRIGIGRLLESFSESEVEQIEKLPQNSLKGIKKQEHFFKIIQGDLMMHYPYGRVFVAEDIDSEAKKFFIKDRVPTGVLSGKKVKHSLESARIIESFFDDENIKEQGSRRYAWVFPSDIKREYIQEKAHYELSFSLPKGSYATVLVAMLRGMM